MCFLEPGDPTPDACLIATAHIGEEESAVDLLLLSRLNVYIHMIEEQLRNPALEYFPASGAVYARASIQVIYGCWIKHHWDCENQRNKPLFVSPEIVWENIAFFFLGRLCYSLGA